MASTTIGSYGMGGPGFLGLALAAQGSRPAEWLILCLWGAAEWCLFDGIPIHANQRSRMKCVDTVQFENIVSGSRLLTAHLDDKSCEMVIERSVSRNISTLEIPQDTRRLPIYAGTGRRRQLAKSDSLLDAWVLSPTDELYV